VINIFDSLQTFAGKHVLKFEVLRLIENLAPNPLLKMVFFKN